MKDMQVSIRGRWENSMSLLMHYNLSITIPSMGIWNDNGLEAVETNKGLVIRAKGKSLQLPAMFTKSVIMALEGSI